jgi:hypothetical protein
MNNNELTDRIEKLEAALGDLAEAALMGSGALLVRGNPYLCDLVIARRDHKAAEHQVLVERSRAERQAHRATADARPRV